MERDEQLEAERLFDSREAAKYLGVSPRTLQRLVSPRGQLPAVRFGQILRFRREDLRQFIAAHVA
ncbi:Helix-turn-helix domain protein [Caulifigura coniformis]|uniref:Helix-turn-helix domain protein n=1 Tax=Caulifigura coniformis TaxID=2527983 RepID=A0A517SEV4_9PLAN|nr:Helix-turn-helix domain protein [Caulifigura coniformis]